MNASHQPFEPGVQTWPRVASLRRRLTEDPAGVRAVVVGAGVSGLSACRLLEARGADVRVVDDRPRYKFAPELQASLERLKLGPIEAAALADADLVVLSPGVPRRQPALEASIREGRLVGEIEMASWFCSVPLIGITGTNGKSTTTGLVAHMLQCAGQKVFVGGNFGRPLSELALGEPVDVAVVELSSYQLESIVEAQFRVSCWLNLTPDHLDRYANVEEYAAAKRRIVERRSINGIAVLNADDAIVSDAGRSLGEQVRWFSTRRDLKRTDMPGTHMLDAVQAVRVDGDTEESYRIDGAALIGEHNRANACAAIECVRYLGASPAAIQRSLSTFEGLPHRLQRVATVGRGTYYNDSKATNIEAAVTAVGAVPEPVYLIAGGVDKGSTWAPLVDAARGRVEVVYAIGEAAPLVQDAFTSVAPVEMSGTLDAAVEAAAERLRSSGQKASVLLAPACASFDQFANYQVRGDSFCAAVRKLSAEDIS
ncbi:MAG: UDP-N-acetylmuramoyl-L-alanine--D-glutamate ligase [Myxococcota bacterium]